MALTGYTLCAGASSSAAEAGPSRITTRSRARAAAAASPTGPSPTDPVVRLPAALAQLIFLLLPLHDRMRCREVSRAWRAALADRGCWRVLRFAGCEDLPRVRDHPGVLRSLILAAGRAAGGTAEEIDARGLPNTYGLSDDTLLKLAQENGGSLRVVRVSGTCQYYGAAFVRCFEYAASWLESGKLPHLEEFEADVTADSVSDARRLLDDARQPDGRFKALRIRRLEICADGVSRNGVFESPEKQREVAESQAELLRTAAPGHPSLAGLCLKDMPLLHPGLMDAVADAAVACGLEELRLYGWHIDHTCLPALSRALRSGRLRSLELHGSLRYYDDRVVLNGPRGALAEFCAALRGSRLESLELCAMRLWADPDNGRALLAALTAHPTLRGLYISWNRVEVASMAAAPEAVAALLEANAPALKFLNIGACGLDGEHLERIMGALHGNTHVAALGCEQLGGSSAGVDEAFAERVVLPLVKANTTLRRLEWDSRQCGIVGEEINRIMQTRAD